MLSWISLHALQCVCRHFTLIMSNPNLFQSMYTHTSNEWQQQEEEREKKNCRNKTEYKYWMTRILFLTSISYHLVSHPWAKYLMCFHFYAFSNISCRVSFDLTFFCHRLLGFSFIRFVSLSYFFLPQFFLLSFSFPSPSHSLARNLFLPLWHSKHPHPLLWTWFGMVLYYFFFVRFTDCPHFNMIQCI